MLDIITFIYSACTDEFFVIRVELFIVNFNLKLIKFGKSSCIFKRGIRKKINDNTRMLLVTCMVIPGTVEKA